MDLRQITRIQTKVIEKKKWRIAKAEELIFTLDKIIAPVIFFFS